MKIYRSPQLLTKQIDKLRRKGKTIGFVPTMGALHKGHLSLIRKARRENDVVVVSIFVNPTQFGRGEDLACYPRRFGRDRTLCSQEGVDYIFAPSSKSLYSAGSETYVNVENLTTSLCGAKRPGHFRGVVTIVAKLFNIVKPDTAYFGKKDYQQALVIRKMVRDLNFDVRICLCPLIREKDGLALSSRNAYLSPSERKHALALSRSLKYARELIKKRERTVKKIKNRMRSMLRKNVGKIDYLEIVDATNLTPLRRVKGKALIALACYVGKTRLIDNCVITVG